MIRPPTLVFALFTLSFGCAAAAHSAPQHRVIETEAGHEVQPASFDEMWKDAAAIVHGRVISATPQLSPPSPFGTSRAVTEIRLHVTEQLKGNLSLPVSGELTVYQLAGEFSTAEVTVRQLGVEPLASGHEYVLFLGWNPVLGRWMVRGNNGTFEVVNGRMRPFGSAPVVRERKAQSATMFLDELRQRGEKQTRQP